MKSSGLAKIHCFSFLVLALFLAGADFIFPDHSVVYGSGLFSISRNSVKIAPTKQITAAVR